MHCLNDSLITETVSTLVSTCADTTKVERTVSLWDLYLDQSLPHTKARLEHMLDFFSDPNLGLLNPYTLLIYMLPTYLLLIQASLGDLHDRRRWHIPNMQVQHFCSITPCLYHYFFLYEAIKILSALYYISETPGASPKLLLALDLLLGTLVVLAIKSSLIPFVMLLLEATLVWEGAVEVLQLFFPP